MCKKMIYLVVSLFIAVLQACAGSPAIPVVAPFTATSTLLSPTPTPTEMSTPTNAPLPTPTAIPLTWKQVSTGDEFPRETVIAFEIDSNDPDVLYIHMEHSGYYKSIDGGNSWQSSQYAEIPLDIQPALSINRNHNSQWDYAIAHTGPDGIKRIYRAKWSVSENGGKNWREFGIGGKISSNAITFDTLGYVYIFCDYYLCKYSPDGKQRITLGKPDIGAFTIISISPHDPDIVYVTGSGIAVSKDGGLTWSKLNNGLGSQPIQLDIGLNDPPTLYLQPGTCVENDYGLDKAGQPLYLSTDGGRTWIPSIETGCYLIKDVNGSTIFRVGQGVAYSESAKHWIGWLWRSQDGGVAWQKIYAPDFIKTVIAHPAESGILYGYKEDSIRAEFANYISTDYGHTWKKQEPRVPTKTCHGLTPQFIDAYRPMAINPHDGNHVLYVENEQIWISDNSCKSVRFINFAIRDANSIAFDPDTPGVLYAGTDGGAYISFDSGQTWGQINDGLLGATVVYSIVVDKDSNVYAATPYGIYQLEKQ